MALGHITLELPATWWMYLGGPLGLMSIALMAILVLRLRVTDVRCCINCGPITGFGISDLLLPSLGNTVYLVTIIGTLFALVGAIVYYHSLRFKATKSVKSRGHNHEGYIQTVTGPVKSGYGADTTSRTFI